MISHAREKYSQEMMMLPLALLLPVNMDGIFFHVREAYITKNDDPPIHPGQALQRAKKYMFSHVREAYSQEMMMLTLTLLLPATMDEIFHVKESTSHK